MFLSIILYLIVGVFCTYGCLKYSKWDSYTGTLDEPTVCLCVFFGMLLWPGLLIFAGSAYFIYVLTKWANKNIE